MPTYRFRLDGPQDALVQDISGVSLTSNPAEPSVTKDYMIDDANDLQALQDALGTGMSSGRWIFVGEIV